MKKGFLFVFTILLTLLFLSSCSTSGKKNDDDDDVILGIHLNTDPAGASVYLDGTNLHLFTPTIIEEELLIEGDHHVRLYLDGYNEINIYVNYEEGDGVEYDMDMAEPQPPLPIITIDTPEEGQSFDDNVVLVQGNIVMEDRSPFLGDNAILNINGSDWLIGVYEGNFYEYISIGAGTNEIWMRANSENGDTGISDLVTVYGNFSAPDIEVVLYWNTPTSDMDLHIWNPLGEHCYYWNMLISDGSLDIDDTEGYGPETFTAPIALDGTYVVQVNSYSLDEDAYADATVQLYFEGGYYDTYGPHHFVTADYNSDDPDAWWEVVEFTVTNGRILKKADPISDEIRQKIARDMQELIRK
jgi:hypothetical protein